MASSPSRASTSQPPTTPKTPKTPSKVRIPKAATTYSPTVSNPELRSQINASLLSEGHIEKIHTTLSHALSAHNSNWPTRVRTHALALLRSGEATTFTTLMQRVLLDIKTDTEAQTSLSNASTDVSTRTSTNANSDSNPNSIASSNTRASKQGVEILDSSSQSGGDTPGRNANGGVRDKEKGREKERKTSGISLAVPRSVVEQGLEVTRECLRDVIVVEE